MANGKVFDEVKDIIESGEIPQKVSNRLHFALSLAHYEISQENKKVLFGTSDKDFKNGLINRVISLEEDNKEKKEKRDAKTETYWKPLISSVIGAGVTLFVAYITGLFG